MATGIEMRGAIGVHKTDTSEGEWDGPAHEARLREGEEAEYYRRAYAWADPDGDPETKSGYRFIHHEVDGDGNIGPANMRACSTGIGVLNGGRGGTTIPDSDREGVHRHLAAHMRDGGMEPPDLRRFGPQGEIRRRFEVRELQVYEDAVALVKSIKGLAVPYGVESEDFGYIETIAPGGFRKSVQERDVFMFWNHNSDYPMGRVGNGSLALADEAAGVRFRNIPPDTQYGRDFAAVIGAGLVNKMSFGFYAIPDKEEWTYVGGVTRRLIREAVLIEISPVPLPAYEQTEVSLRAALRERGIDMGEVASALMRARGGRVLSFDAPIIRSAIEVLSRHMAEPGQGPHSGGAQGHAEPGRAPHSEEEVRARLGEMCRRRLRRSLNLKERLLRRAV